MIAWLTLSFEGNFGAATMLGMVGAGGIGYTITAAMGSFRYAKALAAVTVIMVFMYAIEISFNKLKQKMKA